MLTLFTATLLLVGAAAIEVRDEGSAIVVESGAGLDVTFDSDNCDITSLMYEGIEYQSQVAYSHLASGLGSDATVEYDVVGDRAVVSCSISNEEFNLTQYHVFKDGSSTIALGTYTLDNPQVGELRFLFRLQGLSGAYPTGNVSDTRDGTVIESKDIWKTEAGETRAKHYSAERFIDDQIHCAYGAVYACFIKPIRAYEASTGGPFQRDIRLNLIQDDHQDVTYYMNHGDYPWDVVRTGFHGPYLFTFAESLPAPSKFGNEFLDELDLQGYIADGERGRIVGATSGTSDAFSTVVHWYNDDHQQWVYAKSDGSFESPLLAPGVYTQAFYQEELLAGTATVTVQATVTATITMSATNPIITEDRTNIFQIGDYDGRPAGLLNADKQQRMHVSDARMGDWETPTYVVGKSKVDEFPMAIFEDVNNDRKIQFTLPNALSVAAKLRIGTTQSFYWGKPTASINGYSCPEFSKPNGAGGRGITKGITHGDMTVYTCDVPSGTLVAGTNTATLGVTSSRNGTTWLSPNYIIDFVELYY